jgi:hypothetical protein
MQHGADYRLPGYPPAVTGQRSRSIPPAADKQQLAIASVHECPSAGSSHPGRGERPPDVHRGPVLGFHQIIPEPGQGRFHLDTAFRVLLVSAEDPDHAALASPVILTGPQGNRVYRPILELNRVPARRQDISTPVTDPDLLGAVETKRFPR